MIRNNGTGSLQAKRSEIEFLTRRCKASVARASVSRNEGLME